MINDPEPAFKTVSIGSALVDVFIKSSDFKIDAEPPHELHCVSATGKLDVDSFEVKTGGGGSNTAVGFARMGFQSHLVSELGKDDLADLVISDLTREHVQLRYLIHEKKEQTGGSVLLVTPDGERVAMTHRGAASMLDPLDIPTQLLYQADWVHISSLSGRIDSFQTICTVLQRENPIISWNPGGQELQAIAAGQVNIETLPVAMLFVNKQEWQILERYHERLQLKIPFIIVTDGKHGGMVFSHQYGVHSFEAKPVNVVDVTGAGDAFAVGFVSAFLLAKPFPDMIEIAIKNSASVVQYVGAKPGLLRLAEL